LSTTIYWFSGTGNTLSIAQTLADRLDATLVPIASLPKEGVVKAPSEVIGLACPVYFFGLPMLVREFLDRFRGEAVEYSFLVLTMGGIAGVSIIDARRRLRRAGTRLDAAFALRMPGNYIAKYNARSLDGAKRLLADAERTATRVAKAVAARQPHRALIDLLFLPISALIYLAVGQQFESTCRTRDARFLASDACTRCGICATVCPVRNITLSDGMPVWHGQCEQCFACVHFCPAEAIQIRGTRSDRRRRYHHPNATYEAIGAQASRQPHPCTRSEEPEE
jgi:ferredoxin